MSTETVFADDLTRNEAITHVIESVALEEAALADILSAEATKIQTVLAMDDVTSEEILATNASVQSMITSISQLEMILQSKLSLVSTSDTTDDTTTDDTADDTTA